MKTMNEIIKSIQTLCGNKELVMKHYYTRDGGHGDIVEVSFVMLTPDGENPYFIDKEGNFITEENGMECALYFCDTDMETTLNDFYLKIKNYLHKK